MHDNDDDMILQLTQTGGTLYDAGAFRASAIQFEKARAIAPGSAVIWYNLGLAYTASGNLAAAANSYRRALSLSPGFVEAETNLGFVLQEQGDYDGAMACCDNLLARLPGCPEARFNRAWLELLRGDFANGLPGYELRFAKNDRVARRAFSQPRWDGSPLDGRTILLHAEQGLGDTIQFARYAPLVAESGGRVIVECQPALLPLVSRLARVAQVVAKGAPLPPFDVHAPLPSMPLLFGTTPETIPANVPYLRPDQRLVDSWRQGMRRTGLFSIGLVWAGQQELPINRKRSCPLTAFAPLAGLAGISWYSLQLGEMGGEAGQLPGGLPLTDLTCAIRDFADTAAIIANLDLVISVDTAVAHLAGAMAKPVWTLLPYVPDWRWHLEREDSPWYPTMRLFRQPARGEWGAVIDAVADGLQKLTAERTAAAGCQRRTSWSHLSILEARS